MGREKNERLEELFAKNVPVYSYSKLSTFVQCKYNYYEGYILKQRSKDNIYSAVGSVLHDGLELLYKENRPIKETEKEFFDKIKEVGEKGIKFPENPPTTKSNYIKNISHFFDNYKKMDTKMITEQFVLISIPRFEGATEDKDMILIQAYIDSIYPVYEEIDGERKLKSVVVNDWKTSSKFDKNALAKASKQLLLYKIGVEQSTGVPVSTIGWNMLKYVYCCTYGAKGQIKRSAMQQRKDSVKFFTKSLVKDLIKDNMDTMEAELLVGKCVANNSFEFLPDHIKKNYWIEDCFLTYDFDDDIVESTKQWVIDTVTEIESLGNDVNNYEAIEINEKNNFFCNQLCGRPKCPQLIKYNNDNRDKFKKDKKVEEIDSKLGKSKINLDKLFL